MLSLTALETMYSMSIPPSKRRRTCRLDQYELVHKLPRRSLIGVMKYLDEQSLDKLTKTSSSMLRMGKKYEQYQQKVHKQSIDTEMIDVDEPSKNEFDKVPELALTNDSVKQNKNNILKTNECKHLSINSHLHLNLCLSHQDMERITIEPNRLSVMDILNDMKEIRL